MPHNYTDISKKIEDCINWIFSIRLISTLVLHRSHPVQYLMTINCQLNDNIMHIKSLQYFFLLFCTICILYKKWAL